MRKLSKLVLSLFIVAILNLTHQKVLAYFFVSSTGTPSVLNFDPATGEFTDTFVSNKSSILKFDEVTGEFIDTFVPAGKIGVSAGITFGSDGNLYAVDTANNSVLRFDGNSGAFIDTFVAPGAGGLLRPEDLVFGIDNNLYVSSLYGKGVFRYDGNTGAFIDTIATSVPSNGAKLAAAGLNIRPNENLYISSVFNDNSILRYNPTTDSISTFVSSDIAPKIPGGSTFGPDGNLYIGDYLIEGASIRRYNGETGNFIDTFVPPGSGGLSKASRSTFGSDGNLYVSSLGSDSILRYDGKTGAFIDAFVPPKTGGLSHPAGLAFFKSKATVPESSSYLGVMVFGTYFVMRSAYKRKRKLKMQLALQSISSSK